MCTLSKRQHRLHPTQQPLAAVAVATILPLDQEVHLQLGIHLQEEDKAEDLEDQVQEEVPEVCLPMARADPQVMGRSPILVAVPQEAAVALQEATTVHSRTSGPRTSTSRRGSPRTG